MEGLTLQYSKFGMICCSLWWVSFVVHNVLVGTDIKQPKQNYYPSCLLLTDATMQATWWSWFSWWKASWRCQYSIWRRFVCSKVDRWLFQCCVDRLCPWSYSKQKSKGHRMYNWSSLERQCSGQIFLSKTNYLLRTLQHLKMPLEQNQKNRRKWCLSLRNENGMKPSTRWIIFFETS